MSKCPVCKTPLLSISRFCHICGAPVSGHHPRSGVGNRHVVMALIGMWVAWACWLVFPVVLLQQPSAEAGVGILVVIAIAANVLALFAGLLVGFASPVLLTWWHVIVAICLTVIAEAFDQKGVSICCVVYGVLMFPLVMRVSRRRPVFRHPWLCQKCGYVLYGLTEPRCPECGRPFDPRQVMRGPAADSAGEPDKPAERTVRQRD